MVARMVCARGLLALVAVALLGGCGGGGGESGVPCDWPDYCGPPTAREMLTEILARARLEMPGQGIELADLQLIELHVPRCLEPTLENGAGKHVCKVIFPGTLHRAQGHLGEDGGGPAPRGSADAKRALAHHRAGAGELPVWVIGTWQSLSEGDHHGE